MSPTWASFTYEIAYTARFYSTREVEGMGGHSEELYVALFEICLGGIGGLPAQNESQISMQNEKYLSGIVITERSYMPSIKVSSICGNAMMSEPEVME